MNNFLKIVMSLIGWGLTWMGVALFGAMHSAINVSQNMVLILIVTGFSMFAIFSRSMYAPKATK